MLCYDCFAMPSFALLCCRSAVQCGAVGCAAVLCYALRCSMVRSNAVLCYAVRCSVVLCLPCAVLCSF